MPPILPPSLLRWFVRVAAAVAVLALAAHLASWVVPPSAGEVRRGLLNIVYLPTFLELGVVSLLFFVSRLSRRKGTPRSRGITPGEAVAFVRLLPRGMVVAAALVVPVLVVSAVASPRARGSASVRDGQFTLYEKGRGYQVVTEEEYVVNLTAEAHGSTMFTFLVACVPLLVATGAYQRQVKATAPSGTLADRNERSSG